MPESNRKQAARYAYVSCSHIKEMKVESKGVKWILLNKVNILLKKSCIDIV